MYFPIVRFSLKKQKKSINEIRIEKLSYQEFFIRQKISSYFSLEKRS